MTEVRAVALDAESTGINVFEDRIIQFVISELDKNGKVIRSNEWRINPGVPIPEEAAAVHGFTNEMVQSFSNPSEALSEILIELALVTSRKIPWCLYNANFDLSILVAEQERHRRKGKLMTSIISEARIVDALVIERHYNRYRPGKKRLMDVAPHYGIVVEEDRLHEAGYDVELTAKVAAAQITKYGMPSNAEQAEWHAEWAEDMESYLRRVKEDDTIIVERDWPVRLREET